MSKHFKAYHLFRKVYFTLLDKVMSRNQWHIGVQERHLTFKDPYMIIKRRCVWNKTFLLGPLYGIGSLHASFHKFS